MIKKISLQHRNLGREVKLALDTQGESLTKQAFEGRVKFFKETADMPSWGRCGVHRLQQHFQMQGSLNHYQPPGAT